MGHLPRKPATNARGTSAPWMFGGGVLALALLATLTSGCDRASPEATGSKTSVSSVPEVHVVKPQRRNLTCYGRPTGLCGSLRTDGDLLQGLRLYQAILRGHRRSGEERTT